MGLDLAERVNVSHELHDVWQVLLQPGGGATVVCSIHGDTNVLLQLQDKVRRELTPGVLEDHAGEVEEVDVRDGGLVLESINKLDNDSPDDKGPVSVLNKCFVAVVANIHQILKLKSAELDCVSHDLGDRLQHTPVVTDAVHLHGVDDELHDPVNVGQSEVLGLTLHLLSHGEQGETSEEVLQRGED